MADENKPPPRLSDFKDLLRKLMRVPKNEVEQQEADYREERELARKKA